RSPAAGSRVWKHAPTLSPPGRSRTSFASLIPTRWWLASTRWAPANGPVLNRTIASYSGPAECEKQLPIFLINAALHSVRITDLDHSGLIEDLQDWLRLVRATA